MLLKSISNFWGVDLDMDNCDYDSYCKSHDYYQMKTNLASY